MAKLARSAAKPRTLGEVAVGDEALLADGAWVLVTCRIGFQPYVRAIDDLHGSGPRPMSAHTPVRDSRPRSYAPARDAGDEREAG